MATDDDLATLRARVNELEGTLDAILAADERGQGLPFAEAMGRAAQLLKRGYGEMVPTPDPRDARIAEVEQAAIQWRLRMAELETEAQESDARIAVLEAALREARGDLKVLYMATGGEDADMMYLIGSVDERLRRALGEETSGG